MKTTYLKEFNKFAKSGIAFIPVGTIEWHSTHLPIETDFLVAQRICEIISQKISGYVLPPIYLGTDRVGFSGKEKLIGMDRHVGRKKLSGSLYYLNPAQLSDILISLVKNLKRQGFKNIFIITGHAGSRQIKTLTKIPKKEKGLYFINPYQNMKNLDHADEFETSLFWACYPQEERVGRKNGADEDYLKYKDYDPLKKASLKLGKKVLKEMVEGCLKTVKSELK
ncbi:MAG: creatininase family protein [Parcubacteria group bacterium]|jgi:creatinine amidohydrolase